jgi:hypothetical protein
MQMTNRLPSAPSLRSFLALKPTVALVMFLGAFPAQGWGQESLSHGDAFSYRYLGTAEWSLEESTPAPEVVSVPAPAPSSDATATVRSRKRPTRPLLPLVPAPSPKTADTIPTAKDEASTDETCTHRAVAGKGPSYYERISIAADETAPVPVMTPDSELANEDEEKGGFFQLPDRTTLVSFRETTVDVTRDTVQGIGSAVRTSRGKASELVAQMEIFRPRPQCEDCGKPRRRAPIRRFMAMIRGHESSDLGTME